MSNINKLGDEQIGCSLGAIATALNEAGRLTKRGKQFYPSTIRYILDNRRPHVKK